MVSPAAEAFAESLSTLKFAQRAKGVVVTPQVPGIPMAYAVKHDGNMTFNDVYIMVFNGV